MISPKQFLKVGLKQSMFFFFVELSTYEDNFIHLSKSTSIVATVGHFRLVSLIRKKIWLLVSTRTVENF